MSTLTTGELGPARVRAASGGWLLPTLTVLGFALPAAGYLWFIHQYGVNVVYADQWNNMIVVGQLHSGTLGFGTLWSQFAENRMFFPNLLVVLLTWTTHLNVVVEMYISAFLLLGSVALLVLAHRRRAPGNPLILYCPVAIVMLSFVQWYATLWGFEVSWYLITASLAGTLFLLDRRDLTPAPFAGAVAVAIVGSYSSLQGLYIWPVALLLLWCRRRSWPYLATWAGAGAVTTAVYLIGLDLSQASPAGIRQFVLHHPLPVIEGFLAAVGDVVGQPLSPAPGVVDDLVMAVGAAILVLACLALVKVLRRADRDSAAPLGASLICFGLLFAAFVAYGRTFWGVGAAGASRYTVYDLLILVGTYLVFISPAPAVDSAAAVGQGLRSEPGEAARVTRGLGRGSRVVLGAVVALIGLQACLGLANGVSGGRGMHGAEVLDADVSANAGKVTPTVIWYALYPYGPYSGSTLRDGLLRVERQDRVALFDTGAVDGYRRSGVELGSFAPKIPFAWELWKAIVGTDWQGRASPVSLRPPGAPSARLRR